MGDAGAPLDEWVAVSVLSLSRNPPVRSEPVKVQVPAPQRGGVQVDAEHGGGTAGSPNAELPALLHRIRSLESFLAAEAATAEGRCPPARDAADATSADGPDAGASITSTVSKDDLSCLVDAIRRGGAPAVAACLQLRAAAVADPSACLLLAGSAVLESAVTLLAALRPWPGPSPDVAPYAWLAPLSLLLPLMHHGGGDAGSRLAAAMDASLGLGSLAEAGACDDPETSAFGAWCATTAAAGCPASRPVLSPYLPRLLPLLAARLSQGGDGHTAGGLASPSAAAAAALGLMATAWVGEPAQLAPLVAGKPASALGRVMADARLPFAHRRDAVTTLVALAKMGDAQSATALYSRDAVTPLLQLLRHTHGCPAGETPPGAAPASTALSLGCQQDERSRPGVAADFVGALITASASGDNRDNSDDTSTDHAPYRAAAALALLDAAASVTAVAARSVVLLPPAWAGGIARLLSALAGPRGAAAVAAGDLLPSLARSPAFRSTVLGGLVALFGSHLAARRRAVRAVLAVASHPGPAVRSALLPVIGPLMGLLEVELEACAAESVSFRSDCSFTENGANAVFNGRFGRRAPECEPAATVTPGADDQETGECAHRPMGGNLEPVTEGESEAGGSATAIAAAFAIALRLVTYAPARAALLAGPTSSLIRETHFLARARPWRLRAAGAAAVTLDRYLRSFAGAEYSGARLAPSLDAAATRRPRLARKLSS